MKKFFVKIKRGLVIFGTGIAFLTFATSCEEEKENNSAPIAVTGVSLTEKQVTMATGETRRLDYTVIPANADNPDVRWESDNTAVISINLGVLTAVGAGTANISVITWDGGFTDVCEVIVPFEGITGISFNQKTFEVSFSERVTLPYTITPATASDRNVTWSSSKPEIAEVGEDGVILPKFPGTTIITVTTEEGNFSDNCEVVVTGYWFMIADSSTRSLINAYWNSSSNFFNRGANGFEVGWEYWPQAHCLNAVISAYERTGDTYYRNYFDRWYTGVRAANTNRFTNNFYDDMQWNALAMLRVYNITNDPKWLNEINTVWTDIKGGWNAQAGGGILWEKNNNPYKSSVSNSPASILASRLYQLGKNESDRTWAINIYNWVQTTLYNSTTGEVYDGITPPNTLNTTVYSYNNGTFLGAAVELYKITGDMTYINDAIKAADYTINNLVNGNDTGLLRDWGTGDMGLVNGIFMHYLAELVLCEGLNAVDRAKYAEFIRYNAESLWNKAALKTPQQPTLFGGSWLNKPAHAQPNNENGGGVSFKTQASGAMLIEAAALLEMNYLFVD